DYLRSWEHHTANGTTPGFLWYMAWPSKWHATGWSSVCQRDRQRRNQKQCPNGGPAQASVRGDRSPPIRGLYHRQHLPRWDRVRDGDGFLSASSPAFPLPSPLTLLPAS